MAPKPLLRELPEEFEISETRSVARITIRSTLLSILSIINVERGLGLTLSQLFRSPALLTLAYLGRSRFKVLPPFQLLIFSSTVLSILLFLNPSTGSFLNNLIDGFINYDDPQNLSDLQRLQLKTRAALFSPILLSSYLAALAFLTWFPNRSKGYNYAEILVLCVNWISLVALTMGFVVLLYDGLSIPFLSITTFLIWLLLMLYYFTKSLHQIFRRPFWVCLLQMAWIQTIASLFGAIAFSVVIMNLLSQIQ